jgi:hypothetical protein
MTVVGRMAVRDAMICSRYERSGDTRRPDLQVGLRAEDGLVWLHELGAHGDPLPRARDRDGEAVGMAADAMAVSWVKSCANAPWNGTSSRTGRRTKR